MIQKNDLYEGMRISVSPFCHQNDSGHQLLGIIYKIESRRIQLLCINDLGIKRNFRLEKNRGPVLEHLKEIPEDDFQKIVQEKIIELGHTLDRERSVENDKRRPFKKSIRFWSQFPDGEEITQEFKQRLKKEEKKIYRIKRAIRVLNGLFLKENAPA